MESSTRHNKELRATTLPTPLLIPVAEEPPTNSNGLPVRKRRARLEAGNDENVATYLKPFEHAESLTNRDRANTFPVRANNFDSADEYQRLPDLRPASENSGLPSRVPKMASAQVHKVPAAPSSPTRHETLSALHENLSLPQPTSEPLDFQDQPSRHFQKLAIVEDEDRVDRDQRTYKELSGFDVPFSTEANHSHDIAAPSRPMASASRPSPMLRSHSTPIAPQKKQQVAERARFRRTNSKTVASIEDESVLRKENPSSNDVPPPISSATLPLPPLSIATHLHLELSPDRPSPLYIHRSGSAYHSYESASVKFERLLNFLLLPPQLEQVLLFGALTCLDAWLYTFTILPLRFIKAVWLLLRCTLSATLSQIVDLASMTYRGIARLFHTPWRKRANSGITTEPNSLNNHEASKLGEYCSEIKKAPAKSRIRERSDHSRRASYIPSLLQANHKADLLQGLLIIISSLILLRFDASRMYHAIRGQAAIKLYVIYNVLEVCDRLFSALGQDIMDCLFSPEMLERKPNGRSRIVRPLWMFLLALVYTVFHATAFFYQVITLNVAVNSYSNALLTLLMSNQFVEIKGTVFKKIEKENLFQLTCADVVERFQLWLMLIIIALRNIVELGGLSVGSGDFAGPSSSGSPISNSTTGPPVRTFGILPNAFQIFPSLFPAQVLWPFLLVLGSEMLVDWLKHAYITKFNATSHAVYGRFLDVLAKDYYSNAFAEQNLTRRLGLPVIPLACLFIRAILQTYHMFLATNMPSPVINTATILSLETEATSSPIIAQIDQIFRSALGRSSLGGGYGSSAGFSGWRGWTLDDAIALTTMLVFFLAVYLMLLVFKLVLGMALLSFARGRYNGMKKREKQSFAHTEARRLGGWGTVELGDDRRKIIYEGDAAGLKAMREREAKMKEQESKAKTGDRLDGIDRYSMVAKRIW